MIFDTVNPGGEEVCMDKASIGNDRLEADKNLSTKFSHHVIGFVVEINLCQALIGVKGRRVGMPFYVLIILPLCRQMVINIIIQV